MNTLRWTGKIGRKAAHTTGTALLVASFGLILTSGCTSEDTSGRPTFSQRQRQALEDPFGYSTFDQPSDHYNVSGGNSAGIKRDLDHVFNP